jgi:hypothetical protein
MSTDHAAALPAYEKLGSFYLGREHDLATGTTHADRPVLYDAKDLCTHAVCVGMTGSGKTGLCVSLLEEAALDHLPALVIDPKGDIANLLLTFPELRAEDFAPWVDAGEAQRKGMTLDAYAASRAELWRRGLSEWDQDGARIARLRAATDMAVYTPGSSAGLALTPLRSFDAPAPSVRDNAEAMRERVVSAVSGLLALLDLPADPVQSREHILLSTILQHCWAGGRGASLEELIALVQRPPFEKVGVLGVDGFLPEAKRFELAMRMNNLLASPGFAGWLEGEPLDMQRLLYTPEGKPRVCILSIAHLSEAERMFVVTLALTELIAWMRQQPGTTSLRALFYMDEVFGYFPPTANPASKVPLLTLMKQARAYGVGCVLATQNPVDLDYKGLSNAGTWLLGRLQTERDKARVLDGLEGAAASAGGGFDRAEMEQTLAGLGNRVFLMHNVHDERPVVFQTRWAMSYLRGPMTRAEIARLMEPRKAAAAGSAPAAPSPTAAVAQSASNAHSAAAPAASIGHGAGAVSRANAAQAGTAPAVGPGVRIGYVPIAAAVGASDTLVYKPALFARASLHFVLKSAGVDEWHDLALLAPFEDLDHDPWGETIALPPDVRLETEPDSRGTFADLPAAAGDAKRYKSLSAQFKDHIVRHRSRAVYTCKDPKFVTPLGQDEGQARVRLRELLHEQRDAAIADLREKYAGKLRTLEERLRKAEAAVDREKSQARRANVDAVLGGAGAVLGVLLGRKKISTTTVSKASTAAGRAGRAFEQRGDVARAEDTVESVRELIAEVEAELSEEIEAVRAAADESGREVTETVIAPRKTELGPCEVVLAWVPYAVGRDGRPRGVFRTV